MEVTYIPEEKTIIVNRVNADGICQHKSTHHEYDDGDPEEITMVVCNHCGAYRRILSSHWVGIQVMPL